MTQPIEQEILSHFQAHDGQWIVEKGQTREADMFKRAVARIKQLQQDLDDAEASVADWEDHFDEELAETMMDYEAKRDDFAAAYDSTIKHMTRMRNAAKAYVTVSDEFLNEGKNEPE